MKATFEVSVRIAIIIFLALATWATSLLHVTAQPPPLLAKEAEDRKATSNSFFIPKKNHGIHHLVLHGAPFTRGRAEGALTKEIFKREEAVLFSEFERFFPHPILRYALILGAMRYFWGVEDYFPLHMRQYFYGQAPAASSEYNHYIDPYTRQAVLHGIHEVGQMSVDLRHEGFGCTAFALPTRDSWVIGRNFDFAIDRLFDEEKTLKWHFPSEGSAYASLSWPGFLGTVTGVNEHGLYISLNAAGSQDFRRYGLPTTLLATEILQYAENIDDALVKLENANTFITDIFLLADKTRAFRVEKSPLRTRIIPINTGHAVTNHLIHPDFADDPINHWRKVELTSLRRERRAKQLVFETDLNKIARPRDQNKKVLQLLRDKSGVDGERLHLAHRGSIDALLASHSVIYHAGAQQLYVSTGPGLVGEFVGFDLEQSFRTETPVRIGELKADPDLGPNQFYAITNALKRVGQAEQLVKSENCDSALKILNKQYPHLSSHNYFHLVYGKAMHCIGDDNSARKHWRIASALKPGYQADRNFLTNQLQTTTR